MAAPEQAIDPIHQFNIVPLFSEHVGPASFTNASLFMVIVTLAVTFLMVLGTSGASIIPSRLQAAAQAVLSAQPALKPQYCEIVDLETMASVASTAGKSCAIAIACHLGATRLIDNADL